MQQAGIAQPRSGFAQPSLLSRVFQSVDARLERHSTLAIAAFVTFLCAACIGTALRLPLWLDEIYTLFMVNQPSIRALIHAGYEGCDQQAPLYSCLAHILHSVVRNDALALRLPAIAGFCIMAACVFFLVRRSLGATYALLASLVATCSLLHYATEARSYGLVLGFTSLTLLFWQRAYRGPRRGLALTGVAICGSFAIASQYYSVFFLGALFAAELISDFLTRKWDIPLYATIVAPFLVLIPHYPLIRAARPFFAHFWSPASAHSATGFYDTFFGEHTWVWILGLFLYALAQFAPDPRPEAVPSLPQREWIAYAVLSIAPVLVVVFVLFTVKIFVSRYTIWAIPPIVICIVAGLHRATHASRIAPFCGIVAFLGLLGFIESKNLHSPQHLLTGETARTQLAALPANDTPIFVANHQVYLENWYYASPQLRSRLYYALDANIDMQYGWPDTGPAIIKILRNWAPIQAPDIKTFLNDHPHFLVVADGRDWVPAYLLSLRYKLVPVRTDHTFGLESLSVVYDVSRP